MSLDKAVELIKEFEGFVGHVYDDGFGNPTIGYGETDPKILKKYKGGISEPEAAALLAVRVKEFMDAVHSYMTREPSDNQLVAHTSLAYNIGKGGFQNSTTLKRHNDGDVAGAAEAILWWNKVDGRPVAGLTRRRQREYDLYLSSSKPAPAPIVEPGITLPLIGLISLNSALAIEVQGGSTDNGAGIWQWPANEYWNQEFSLVPFPGGEPNEVVIVCGHSGKVLDVAEWSLENGARVIQWDYHGGFNQRWRVFAEGNVLLFQNYNSGKYLDVHHFSVDPGGQLVQWEQTGNQNQMFLRVRKERNSVLNPVYGPPPPAPDPGTPPPDVDPNFDVGAALRSMGFPFGNEEDIYGFQGGFSFYDISVDGNPGPETVAAIQFSLERGGRCGEFFTYAEFGCKHCGRPRIWRDHVRALDAYRRHVGPVSIVSGTRCDEHNAKVGGATNSQHRPFPNNRGVSTATDIPGVLHVNDVKNLGLFSGIGYVRSNGLVIHVDSRGNGPNNTTGGTRSAPTTWEYA